MVATTVIVARYRKLARGGRGLGPVGGGEKEEGLRLLTEMKKRGRGGSSYAAQIDGVGLSRDVRWPAGGKA